ncbi:MAG: thioredoxin fold domain-containing protein [Bacteroidota bacterium]
MKKILLALVILVSNLAIAQQDSGIHFEHASSWKAVQEKAKAENKFIFMDAFTTWCGPCRMMAKEIFPLKEVGAFFNANYISLKVQLDTTKKDNEEIKKWYADAHAIMRDYKVNVFPTYLFFSPDGKLVHRAVGSSEAAAFIAKGKDALDPNKQYFTLAARYEAGEKSPAFLKALAQAALNAYDRDKIGVYGKEYLATQTDLLTEENIKFLDEFTQTSKDPGFEIMYKNTAAFNKVMGEGKAEEKIKGIVLREEVFPVIFESEAKPDWTSLESKLTSKYPTVVEETISYAKVLYYKNTGDWPSFSAAVTNHLKNYGNKTSADELNSYAWTIFENCNDLACINQAISWSKKSVDLTNNPMFIDTYANLLYKTGKKDVAIQWEEKALTILKEKNQDLTGYQETIEKMKKGEKTW